MLLFVGLLAGIGFAWLCLALLAWLTSATVARMLLVLFTGVFLLAGFAWYAVTSWAWRRGRVTPNDYLRPGVLFVFAWLLCLGSALASSFGLREGSPETTAPAKEPPSKTFPDGPRRFLSDMEMFDVQSGPWPVTANGKLGNEKKDPIRVSNLLSPKGISMHPPWAPAFASAKFHLEREAAVFKAIAAIDDSSNWCWSPATFTVLGDGKELWKSKGLSHTTFRTDECSVDVTGVNILELRVQVVNGSNGDHAVWVEPRLLRKADTPDEK
jgi:hypothetical protein